MTQFCLISLTMLALPDPPAQTTKASVADAIRAVLDQKGKAYPYFAQYEFDLPAQPRPSGGTRTHRYFAESAERQYYEQTSPTDSLKILLEPRTLSFAYDEPLGAAICTGPANIAGAQPERWLGVHGFPIPTTAELDADIVSHVKALLEDSEKLRQERVGDIRTYHLSSRLGPLTIVLAPARVEISRPAERKEEPVKLLLRYAHGQSRPPWYSVVADLSARVKGPKSTAHRMVAEFTFVEALAASNPEFDNRLVAISPADEKRLAQRHGYVILDRAVAKVLEAKTMSGQLHYVFESGGSKYSISQYPKASRIQDDETIARFVRARRKLDDYAVLDVVSPGTGANWLYYIKADSTLIVADPDHKRTLKFEDPTLDAIVRSLAPPSHEPHRP
jgi:hypothetical protein